MKNVSQVVVSIYNILWGKKGKSFGDMFSPNKNQKKNANRHNSTLGKQTLIKGRIQTFKVSHVSQTSLLSVSCFV